MKIQVFFFSLLSFCYIVSCSEKATEKESQEILASRDYESLLENLKKPKIKTFEQNDLIKRFQVDVAKKTSLRERQGDLLLLSRYLYSQKNDAMYPSIARDLQKVSEKLGDTAILASSYNRTGAYYSRKNLVDSAFIKYYESAKLFAAIGDTEQAGLKWLTMAIIQKDVKDYAGSEASSIKAIEYLTDISDINDNKIRTRYTASAYNNLGILAKERGQYQTAIDYYNRAIEYRKRIDVKGFLAAGTYNNIGLVHAKNENYEEAISYYRKGLAVEQLRDSSAKTYARLVDNMAFAMYQLGQKENLDSLFDVSLSIREELNDIYGIGTSNFHIATYKASQGKNKEAEEYAFKALEQSKKTGDNRGQLQTLELLSEILPAERGIVYAKEHMNLFSNIEQADRTYQDQFARVRYETDVLLDTNKRVTRNFRQLTIAFLTTIVVFLLGYIWRQRVTARKEEIYQQAQQKSTEEIYSLMLAQSAKIEEGKQLEKKRISEELHDNVLSKLFGIRISLDSVHAKEGSEVVQARAGYLKELQEITQEIRQISHDLNRDIFLKDQLFPEVLDTLITDYGEQTNLEASLSFDKIIAWQNIPDATKAHLYRIIQESLANAHKHGKANQVEVSFTQNDTHILTSIADDGIGLDLKRLKRGIGLKNINSRTEKIGGEFYIDNRIPTGTIIEIKFPKKSISYQT